MDRYIGLDAHASSCTAAVLGPSGRKLQCQVLETNAKALIGFLQTIPKNRRLILEEGTHSNWLYEVLAPHVQEIVVVGVRRSRGPKRRRTRRLWLGRKPADWQRQNPSLQEAGRICDPQPSGQSIWRAGDRHGSHSEPDQESAALKRNSHWRQTGVQSQGPRPVAVQTSGPNSRPSRPFVLPVRRLARVAQEGRERDAGRSSQASGLPSNKNLPRFGQDPHRPDHADRGHTLPLRKQTSVLVLLWTGHCHAQLIGLGTHRGRRGDQGIDPENPRAEPQLQPLLEVCVQGRGNHGYRSRRTKRWTNKSAIEGWFPPKCGEQPGCDVIWNVVIGLTVNCHCHTQSPRAKGETPNGLR